MATMLRLERPVTLGALTMAAEDLAAVGMPLTTRLEIVNVAPAHVEIRATW